MTRRRRALYLGAAGALGLLFFLPAATRVGTDYVVEVRRIPAGIKLWQFLQRDLAYRRLSAEITRGRTGELERVEQILRWTREHVRPTPQGVPVMDDHILSIIERGVGEADQVADVFTTLTTYAGHPGFWRTYRPDGQKEPGQILCCVQVEGRWTVWDLLRGGPARDPQGNLLLAERVIPGFGPPEMLRARQQMPGPRLLWEARRLLSRLAGWGKPSLAARVPDGG